MEFNKQDWIDLGLIPPDEPIEEISPWSILGALAGIILLMVILFGYLIIGDDFQREPTHTVAVPKCR